MKALEWDVLCLWKFCEEKYIRKYSLPGSCAHCEYWIMWHQFIKEQLHVNVTYIVTSSIKVKLKIKFLTCIGVLTPSSGSYIQFCLKITIGCKLLKMMLETLKHVRDLTFKLILILDVTVCVTWTLLLALT